MSDDGYGKQIDIVGPDRRHPTADENVESSK